MSMTEHIEDSLLGKAVSYTEHYDPNLLFPIARAPMRAELGITDAPSFYGADLWTAYEVSWLAPSGKPQVAIAEFVVPAASPYLIESKSLKLYLNSFNQTIMENVFVVRKTIADDLSRAAATPVMVELFSLTEYRRTRPVVYYSGVTIDAEPIVVTRYQADPTLLKTSAVIVTETLYSDLLKSNCLVTGQPDWGSIQISYTGPAIDRGALLTYLIGFRGHNEFHEQCVERIFMDLWRTCKPTVLTVYARYTRRGGLDINPIRSSEPVEVPLLRLVRQ